MGHFLLAVLIAHGFHAEGDAEEEGDERHHHEQHPAQRI